MNDERTPVLNLPLPHPDHLLVDDVARLRTAFTRLDAHLDYGEFVLGLSQGLGIEPPLPGADPGPGDIEGVLAQEMNLLLQQGFEDALGGL